MINTFDPLDVDTLKIFVERLPVLKQSMSAGSTSAVQKSFYKKTVTMSREAEECSDKTTLANGNITKQTHHHFRGRFLEQFFPTTLGISKV